MEVETVFLTCLRITGVHVETDGWTQRRTARGVKQRGTERDRDKGRTEGKCCCVVSWQLCAGQLGGAGRVPRLS